MKKNTVGFLGLFFVAFFSICFSASAMTYNERTLESKRRYESSEFELINKKLVYLFSDANLSQRNDSTKASLREREVLAVWMDAYEDFLERAIRDARKTSPQLLTVLQSQKSEVLATYQKLWAGRISFSIAKQELMTIAAELELKLNAATQAQQKILVTQTVVEKEKERQKVTKAQVKKIDCNEMQQKLTRLVDEKQAWLGIVQGFSAQEQKDNALNQNPVLIAEESARQDKNIQKLRRDMKSQCGFMPG